MSRSDRLSDRRQARQAALQMLYQWEMGGGQPEEVIRNYWESHGPSPPPRHQAFAADLVRGTIARLEAIDPLIAAVAEHWRLSRMAVLDRLILRLAVYEFLHAADAPRPMVINEALELARTFSTEEAVKFINGVLDAVRRQLEERERADR